jgi:hypothetical protein
MKTMRESEFKNELQKIRHFISENQKMALQDIFKGEESQYALDVVSRLSDIIEKMPSTYETEEIETPDKIVHLHYFYGGSDWYIIEKDKGDSEDDKTAGLIVGEQYQSFGYAILGGNDENAEWGYISIAELVKNSVELDFHFEPVKFSEL